WVRMEHSWPADSTVPMLPCPQPWPARYMETKAPKPVCTSAMKKLSQSSACSLRLDGSAASSLSVISPRTECAPTPSEAWPLKADRWAGVAEASPEDPRAALRRRLGIGGYADMISALTDGR